MAITTYPSTYDSNTCQWTLDLTNPKVTHVGRVISVYNKDWRAMSDVYVLATCALVLNAKDEVEEVVVNYNFECDVSGGHAEVDATTSVQKIVADIGVAKEARRVAREESDRKAREEAERNRPVIGKAMKVVKGRKVPVGTVGTVAYISGSSALLKGDSEWKNRQANGVWVAFSNLAAR